MSNVIFRKMQLEDLSVVKNIERECFSTPWSMQSFQYELTQNHMAHYIVAVLNHTIVGYCGSWIIFDEAQITTIATHPHYRRMGIGESVLRYMMTFMLRKGAKNLFLEVRVSNHNAQSLYRKLGFEKIGLRKKYYADNQEDALVMGVDLDGGKQRILRSWD